MRRSFRFAFIYNDLTETIVPISVFKVPIFVFKVPIFVFKVPISVFKVPIFVFKVPILAPSDACQIKHEEHKETTLKDMEKNSSREVDIQFFKELRQDMFSLRVNYIS